MSYGVEIFLKLRSTNEDDTRNISRMICDILKKYELIEYASTLCAWKIEEKEFEDCDGDCDNCKNQCDFDPHEGCYSYPNCDIDPNGCCILMGDDVEPYGHRD